MSAIPVVDLEELDRGTAGRSRVVSDLLAAYGEVGFAYLVGHGVANRAVADVFGASAAFHALPIDRKMHVELDDRHRGFIPIDVSTDRTSTLAEVTRPNRSESFMMMREDPPDHPDVLAGSYLAGPNQWPELDGFHEPVEAYHTVMCELAARVVVLLAEALGDDTGTLGRAFLTPTTWLRLLHYPSVPEAAPHDLFGSAPHADFGCITILAQDEVGGLQVAAPDGNWIDVPYRADAFVMNVGDMLHRWSNGRLRSTPHRVLNRSGRERYSVPFFFDPHVSTVIEPLASCVSPDRPARFEAIEFGAFVRSQLEASYDHHRPTDERDQRDQRTRRG